MTPSQSSHFSIAILPWIICSLGALFYCYELFLRAAPSVMVPQMMGAYGIDAKTFGLALVSGLTTALGMVGGIVVDDLLSNIVSAVGWQEAWMYAAIVGIVLLVVVFLVVKSLSQ